MNTVVAEREIGSVGGAAGRLSLEQPRPDRDDWRCDYEIVWPGRQRRFYAMGVDSFQALQLAMQMAIVDVASSDDFKAGRLTGFGQPLTNLAELKIFFGVERLPGFEQ